MILGNGRTPSGYRVAPMSYAKIEQVADGLRSLLPTVNRSNGLRIDAGRTLEKTMRQGGFELRVEPISVLHECAAFTIPEDHLIVMREDIYDKVYEDHVFARSTVVHETSHIVLKHALTLRRGPIGAHKFYEDSEWQAKALTAAVMMPLRACKAARSAADLAQICGTSVESARYRLERLEKDGLIEAKADVGLFK